MTCDECQEQVFELIEREATEPEMVREILGRCPECRALFDEMKAALAHASRLPIEEPPSGLDEPVLRAARDRSARVAARRRVWFRSPQWAVAAAALLAVGIGVWAIPRPDRVAMEDATGAPATVEPNGPPVEERAEQAYAEVQAAAPAEEVRLAPRPVPEAVPAADEAKTEKNKRTPAPPRPAARPAASAPIERKEVAAAAHAPSLGASRELAAADSADEAPEPEERVTSPECEARLAKVAGDGTARVEAEIDPEDALEIGRCYEAKGNITEARRWLERAASDPRTRRRAMRALKALPSQ